MTFNDVAIHDGRVAGLQFYGNLIFAFDLGKIVDIFSLDGKTSFLNVGNPIATAASGGCPIDCHVSLSGLRGCLF